MELIFNGTVVERGDRFISLDNTRNVTYSMTSISDGAIATVFTENGNTGCMRQEDFLKTFKRNPKPEPIDWESVREMIASGTVHLGGKFALDLIDKRQELEQALQSIASLWPEPDVCGDLSVNGINDGKARLITAHAAVNYARKALGIPLHPFPGD